MAVAAELQGGQSASAILCRTVETAKPVRTATSGTLSSRGWPLGTCSAIPVLSAFAFATREAGNQRPRGRGLTAADLVVLARGGRAIAQSPCRLTLFFEQWLRGLMRRKETSSEHGASERIPNKGERVERPRTGILLRGTVFYSDQLQILVKWDNGRSESLRPGRDRFRVISTT